MVVIGLGVKVGLHFGQVLLCISLLMSLFPLSGRHPFDYKASFFFTITHCDNSILLLYSPISFLIIISPTLFYPSVLNLSLVVFLIITPAFYSTPLSLIISLAFPPSILMFPQEHHGNVDPGPAAAG